MEKFNEAKSTYDFVVDGVQHWSLGLVHSVMLCAINSKN